MADVGHGVTRLCPESRGRESWPGPLSYTGVMLELLTAQEGVSP